MREWNLKSGDPLSLTLATDARLEPIDYYNDQIWELRLEGGTPPALALHSTFGLRARSLRLFPVFTEGETTLIDPKEFNESPAINQIHPNFIQISYSPFPEIDVKSAYWVPQSQAITGRLWITNTSNMARQIQFEWVGQLSPTEGQRMAPVEIQAAKVLCGSTEDLTPVIFFTEGPVASSGSYPALRLSLELSPGEVSQFTWALAALSKVEDSFTLARSIAAQQWEAERSRLEMINAGLIEIYTGEPDWDTTFMLAQKEAFSLFMGPTSSLPYSSYVQNRQIDQGYSLRGDGSDYSHLWNGQSPIESYYLTKMILPMAPDLAQGLIYNFLSVQEDDGFIDWKPGLGGQRSRLLATPLLASLAWYVYESSEDREFLENIYAGLKKFFHKWLAPENDRDGDGIPEWGHPLQLGAEDHPVYSYWHDDSQGIDITTIESTALNTWLYQECQSLIKIATALRDMESVAEFRSFGHRFKEAVEDSWDEDAGAYQNRDRDSHQSADTVLLAQNSGAGIILIQHTFEVPVRLLIHLNTSRGTKPHPQIFVHGTSVSGLHRVEKITVDQFRWFSGKGVMTAQNVYTEIEQIDVQGLEAGDETAIYTAGSSWLDYTSLLPLWAGIPSAEQAQIMIENCITNPERFWHPYGLTSCPHFHEANATAFCSDIQPIWNQFLGEGLVVFGYRELAAELVTRLMNAMIANLKEEGAFQRFYNADTGKGVGDRNVLGGLPPLGLFMETLGVRLISAHKVMLEGFNPFPWPVTIKYRGLTIVRQREKTIVVFPDGQTVNIDDTKQRVVSLE